MISSPVLFYIASSILIVFALLTMFAKNIIYSLLSSVMVFFSTGLLFYFLGSEYNAIIQTAIYGFAVPIIIGLSIMFGGKCSKCGFTLKYTTILSSLIFCLGFVYVIMMSVSMLPETFNTVEVINTNSYEVISSFAKGIFINYVWAFELVSLLLTVVIAGLTLFRKRGV